MKKLNKHTQKVKITHNPATQIRPPGVSAWVGIAAFYTCFPTGPPYGVFRFVS